MDNNPLVYKFIKTADRLNEEHPLFDSAVEDTIAKLGLPYAMAQSYRIAMKRNMSEDEKNAHIAELREHQQTVISEQQELQKRFLEHLELQSKIEAEKEDLPEIIHVDTSNNEIKNE